MSHIILDNVHVSFPVFNSERQKSLLSIMTNRASFGRVAKEVGRHVTVEALQGININIKEGDRVGLIGRNGSGKSTLLRAMARMIEPNIGHVDVQGTVACFFDLGAGLDLEKTGIENIKHVCRLLSVPKSESKTVVDDVVEFTELGEFIMLPVRTYSSGMIMRLSFGIATAVSRDILLIDEVIGAGDAFFLEKAKKRMKDLFQRTKILVVATHSPEILIDFCDTTYWLEQGKVVSGGASPEVWHKYLISGETP